MCDLRKHFSMDDRCEICSGVPQKEIISDAIFETCFGLLLKNDRKYNFCEECLKKMVIYYGKVGVEKGNCGCGKNEGCWECEKAEIEEDMKNIEGVMEEGKI